MINIILENNIEKKKTKSNFNKIVQNNSDSIFLSI